MLNSTDIAIFLVAQELGIEFEKYEMHNEQRILFQKLFYLIGLTEEGRYLKTDFSLNSRGPYSPDLAEIGHEIAQEYSELKETAQLNDEGIELARKLHECLPETIKTIIENKSYSEDIEKVEAIATMLMFYKNYSCKNEKDKIRAKVILDLVSLKAELNELDLNQLYDEAVEFYSNCLN